MKIPKIPNVFQEIQILLHTSEAIKTFIFTCVRAPWSEIKKMLMHMACVNLRLFYVHFMMLASIIKHFYSLKRVQ
jgi:hypothetical protein